MPDLEHPPRRLRRSEQSQARESPRVPAPPPSQCTRRPLRRRLCHSSNSSLRNLIFLPGRHRRPPTPIVVSLLPPWPQRPKISPSELAPTPRRHSTPSHRRCSPSSSPPLARRHPPELSRSGAQAAGAEEGSTPPISRIIFVGRISSARFSLQRRRRRQSSYLVQDRRQTSPSGRSRRRRRSFVALPPIGRGSSNVIRRRR